MTPPTQHLATSNHLPPNDSTLAPSADTHNYLSLSPPLLRHAHVANTKAHVVNTASNTKLFEHTHHLTSCFTQLSTAGAAPPQTLSSPLSSTFLDPLPIPTPPPVWVFITAGPITKLCASGEEDSGGHVL